MERLNAFRVACFRKNSESIQCCIPGAVAEISATIKDLKAAWVENDYQKLYQAVTPIAAAVLGVVSFLEEINTSPGTWYATIDLGNVFFSLSLSLRASRSYLVSVVKGSSIPLYHPYINA